MKKLLFKNKSIVVSLLVSLSLGILGGNGNIPRVEYDKLVSQRDTQVAKIAEIDEAITKEKEANAILVAEKEKKDKAAKEEAERIAKEAAEKKAKEEAERKAKEEAEKKAEEERLAKEEAERLAREEAERIAQEEAASSVVYNNSTESEPSYDSSEPIGQMVWLSATGEKYHSINNCGRMNPNNARQVTLEYAQSNYERCTKCW